jgi:isoleucyl-tRNA synthetase
LVLQKWPEIIDLSEKSQVCIDVQTLLNLKESKVNESLENLRVKKEIGQSLDAEVSLHIPEDCELDHTVRRFNSDELAELFIVSQVIVCPLPAGEDIRVSAQHASGVRCPRSWRWVPELVHVEPWGEVSPRCAEVLANLS